MLEPYALVTVGEMGRYLDLEDLDDDEVEELEESINAYSNAIRLYCDREFKPPVSPDADVTRRFRYKGGGYLDLAPYELRSLAVADPVKWGTDTATPITWAAADFRLEPRNGTLDGTYLWLALPRLARSGGYPSVLTSGYDREVTIAGRWGMLKVPPDVKRACRIAVANGYRNREGFASRTLGGFTVTEESGGAEGPGQNLPVDARGLLTPYVRLGGPV